MKKISLKDLEKKIKKKKKYLKKKRKKIALNWLNV